MTPKEVMEIYSKNVPLVFQALESVVRSSTIILIEKIDKEISDLIYGLYYQIHRRRFRVEQETNVPEEMVFMFPDPRTVEHLEAKLSTISIPQLIEEYLKSMKGEIPRG